MDNTNLRAEIDEIDRAILALFAQRMKVSAAIAAYKQAKGLPVRDERREAEKLRAAAEASPADIREDAARLFRLLMELSRGYQERLIGGEGAAAAPPEEAP